MSASRGFLRRIALGFVPIALAVAALALPAEYKTSTQSVGVDIACGQAYFCCTFPYMWCKEGQGDDARLVYGGYTEQVPYVCG